MTQDDHGEETYVRKFGFRRFSGIRQNRIYRVFSVSWFNLIEAIKRSGFTKMLLIFMFFSLLIQDVILILFSSFLPFGLFGELTIEELFRGGYIDSVLGMVSLTNRVTSPLTSALGFFTSLTTVTTSFIWLLLLAQIGGGLIADDRLYMTTEMYLSRISRLEYIIGKLGSLVIFSALIVVLPALIQFFLLGGGLGLNLLPHLDLLGWALGFTISAAIFLSLFVLSISSLTTRRNFASLATFIFTLSMSILPTALGGAISTTSVFLALDFVGCLAILSLVVLGFDSVLVNNRTIALFDGNGFEAILAVISISLVICVSLLIIINFLFREDN
ncbi:MAG: hypothetical protein GF411_11885 [Candidatus Lokiarchaeota archaeon]|nr:hypothetical protein [Candidatus Lokiarchaeota archaeon]